MKTPAGKGGASGGLIAVVSLGLHLCLQGSIQFLVRKHGVEASRERALGIHFVSFVMMVICYLGAALSTGDRIQGWPWDPRAPRGKGPPATPFELKSSNGKPRFCKTCKVFKPDRAHHCHRCGQCHLGMDHHDILILNCVHHKNQKYFFLFLFYAAAHAGVSLYILNSYSLFPDVYRTLDRREFEMDKFFLSMQYKLCFIALWSISLFYFIVFGAWFMFYALLVAYGYKTIEFTEKRLRAIDSAKSAANRRSVLRVWSVLNPYSRGVYTNLRNTLGVPLLWLFPIIMTAAGSNPELGYRPILSKRGESFFNILNEKWKVKGRKTK